LSERHVRLVNSGLFTWREEDPRRRNKFSFGLHAEISVGVVARNEIKLSALSSRTPGRRHVCFSVPKTRIFRAKAVYMVLGSS